VIRRALVPAAALLGAAALASPAFAHGGKQVVTVGAGGYQAKVDANAVALSGGRAVIDFTTYLRDRKNGLPVNGAAVTVVARAPGEPRRVLHALAFANTYEVLVPVARGADWRRVRLHVQIAGPVGSAAFDTTPRGLFSTWAPDALPIGLGLLALALYTQAFVRLRRRGRPDHATVGRAALFAAGVAVAVLAVVSPIDAVAEEALLSAHMLQHLLLGDVAPLLVVLGVCGPIGLFLLPQPVLRTLASVTALRRFVSLLLRPAVSFAVWAIALAAWHVPPAYDYALAHPWAHTLEHATFFLGGVLLWTQIVDPARQHRLSYGRRAAFAAGALFYGMVVSEILIATNPLYPYYARIADRPFGLTAASDQLRAGLLMMGEQIATLGMAAALLLWSHVERLETMAGRQVGG
jgi:cytochrome c oxidase assembly factor CtaG